VPVRRRRAHLDGRAEVREGDRRPRAIEIEYLIEGAFEAFEAVPGVDDAARFGGSVVFSVQVDGVERFRSRVVRGGPEEPEPLRVSITGGRVLALIVEEAGDGTEGDFADWGNAKVIAVPTR
jgi:alpha-galactosidase